MTDITINGIREALATNLKDAGVNTYWVAPANLNVPCAVVGFPVLTWNTTQGGSADLEFDIIFIVGLVNQPEQAQKNLADLLETVTTLPSTSGPWRHGITLGNTEPPIQSSDGAYLAANAKITVHA